jgi:hypothetical protein
MGWIRDLGFRKNISRIQGTKKHRFPDPQYCFPKKKFKQSQLNTSKNTILINHFPAYARICSSVDCVKPLCLALTLVYDSCVLPPHHLVFQLFNDIIV